MSSLSPAQPPLVAIVTPVYNGEAYLAETMESVQNQTYPNIVHVVLDNASTDRTAEIIAQYRDRNIPVVVGRNETLLPMDENWNAALKLIPGEAKYFRILCADDVIFPDATRRMVDLAESDPSISVVSTAVLRNDVSEDFRWPQDRSVFEGDEALRRYFTIQGTIEGRQMLLRTEALHTDNPFFDLHVGHSTDIDAALRMMTRGRLGFLHEPLGMVREHAGNASVSEMRPLHIHFNDWLITMRRYGPVAFGEAAYRKLERRYSRFYFRRMLKWRYLKGDRSVFDLHLRLLSTIGVRPRLWDYLDAAIDPVLRRIGMREGWFSYPN